ncbi:EAL domain-containing protein [Halomonas sp. M5N1S17]|uniref:putative bifunctional diguanylate cyclase/phosphodiesterase n=1 Tax=Halomonas alkalisoli TaxID=2907158 RepID=UPI001F45C523|nr:EAL domain-containing protein [Halomonas alkalisoli]MCE9665624.1 EAL domain-containing protein [Halomonas alkalisoli]
MQQLATSFRPHDHAVQFYADEAFLADVVADYLRVGVDAGERLLLLLTVPHQALVLQRLAAGGLDTDAAMAGGQLVVYDADLMLEAIMRDGMPVEALFNRHILAAVEAAGSAPTRAFGELVDLLCARGNAKAAVQLEIFWHAACRRLPLTLLCGYAIRHFDRPGDQAAFDAICRHHTHVMPSEPHGGLASGQQPCEVARPQQAPRLNHERAPSQLAEQGVGLDELTGLATRRVGERWLAEQLSAAAEGDGIAVLHIDVDQLKEINHSLGMEMGDVYLNRIAQRIRRCLADGETVSRLGSDEILVVVPGIRQPEDIAAVVERLLDRTGQPIELAGQTVLASCCIGASLFPEHGRTVNELMRHANLARRQAQRLGRRRYQLFTPELLDEGPDDLVLRTAFQGALARNELELLYRPLLCARSGQVVAVSAKPRWRSSRFGVLESGCWMGAAADNGQLTDVCQWILTNACQHAKSWFEVGIGLRVVVHVSIGGLLDGEFLGRVDAALASSNLPARLLEIEVMESDLVQEIQRAAWVLKQLDAKGVRLSMDGFGSGYSILEHLSSLPLDALKLSGLFISECLDNPRHQAIIRSVIGMAHELDIEVVANGISTRQQADYLRQQGCDLLQGSLWARMEYLEPVPG